MANQCAEVESLKEIYRKIREDALQDYKKFLSFESVGSDPSYKEQVWDCAKWLQDYIKSLGFTTELWETSGNPAIFAKRMDAGPSKPTLLIYNHYDVQPVDPIDQWISPPFEPQERDGCVYARGAQDNKGQCFYVLQGLRTLLLKDNKLPINVKLIIEGEEEHGSHGLSELLKEKQEDLKADYLAIVDLGMRKAGWPAVTLGIRGIITMDLELTGSNTDLHSGSNGGLVYNPLHGLVELLAKLRDPAGKITIPGFYDDVREPAQEERSRLNLDFDASGFEKKFHAKATGGEQAFSPLERLWLRPALEINGLSGGYSGSGFKTVIPAKASAKISCRLVPDMDPQKTARLVANYLKDNAPGGLKAEVRIHPGGGPAVRADRDSQAVKAFAQAYGEAFDKPCEFMLEGASIPIVTALTLASGADVVLVGLGLNEDKIHAPNEHFSLERFDKGVISIARAVEILGRA